MIRTSLDLNIDYLERCWWTPSHHLFIKPNIFIKLLICKCTSTVEQVGLVGGIYKINTRLTR